MAAKTLQIASIYQDIESHPPLMQDEVKGKYIGREVEWHLTFGTGFMDHGEARLMFRSELRPYGGVAGKASLSAYPWLKALRPDEPVRVRGRIREIHYMAIELDILELSLQEPAAIAK